MIDAREAVAVGRAAAAILREAEKAKRVAAHDVGEEVGLSREELREACLERRQIVGRAVEESVDLAYEIFDRVLNIRL